ncbi:glycoside hydrolase family 18 protein [Coniophora puteana RWD-64-598 SS2]|uniref:Glycoside hydrolase family 18 protein n=1 Tax=Coniophora puteana (strain RWD-64-598) TaxID=741705 RepID=A0A5M3MEL5_CONPW|nr:glycoside hydrolase family 18 protein [Coniophora puteana RWD-64-598 SS2]EIW77021.1 glycoside hydrolase family 18 protein [Coniophora puteana RWD-64-598 SS2]
MVRFPLFATLISLTATLAAALPLIRETALVTRAASAQAAPHWVAYQDMGADGENGAPSVDSINGFNNFLLSFWTPNGAVDQAANWVNLDDGTRSSIKSSYQAANIKLMISAFGDQITPTTSNMNPNTTADQLAAFVKQYSFDGVDVDYEDFAAVNKMDGSAETWLIQFTTELRKQLPAGQFVITHAPVGPWFNAVHYKSGAYVTVNKAVGSLIDWYNVQFYNQGTDYETCDTLFTKSASSTSVLQINATGVPLDKIVIGKPALVNSAGEGGFMNTTALASCLTTAKAKGWNAGVMVWQYPQADSTWIQAVRAQAFPV